MILDMIFDLLLSVPYQKAFYLLFDTLTYS